VVYSVDSTNEAYVDPATYPLPVDRVDPANDSVEGKCAYLSIYDA